MIKKYNTFPILNTVYITFILLMCPAVLKQIEHKTFFFIFFEFGVCLWIFHDAHRHCLYVQRSGVCACSLHNCLCFVWYMVVNITKTFHQKTNVQTPIMVFYWWGMICTGMTVHLRITSYVTMYFKFYVQSCRYRPNCYDVFSKEFSDSNTW